MSLLVLHWELDTLAMLPLMGFSIWAITDGTIACFFAIIQFILLGIFNLFTVGLSLAVYSFIQHKCKIKVEGYKSVFAYETFFYLSFSR